MEQAEHDEGEVIETPDIEEQDLAQQPEYEIVREGEPGELITETVPAGEDAAGETSEDEVVVTIEGESPPQEEVEAERAPKWVRELRQRNQETVRENRDLKKRLAALEAAPADKQVTLGEKPTLEGCSYDTEEYEGKLAKWYADKAAHEEHERKKQEEGAKAQREWQAKLDAYGEQARKLKVSDYADAEATAKDVLSSTQQGIIVSGAENPALVVYALGKNLKKAQELASISDPVKFAFAVAKLEGKINMDTKARKSAPMPESTVRGNARVGGAVGDSTLDRLRAEADRTGDRTKVAQYMRAMAAKKK